MMNDFGGAYLHFFYTAFDPFFPLISSQLVPSQHDTPYSVGLLSVIGAVWVWEAKFVTVQST